MNDWTYWANIARDEETRRNNALRDRENEAEDRLAKGKQRIEDEFNGAFKPEFFNNYAQQLMDYWRPDIDRQYSDAQKQLNYGFANTQPGGGSVAADAFGRLKEGYDKALLQASDRSQGQANELRSSIEGQRSALRNQLAAGADPSVVVQDAVGTINNIPRSPTYSPLGDLFSNLTGQFAVAQQAARAGYPGWGFSIGPGNPSAAGGSGGYTIVN